MATTKADAGPKPGVVAALVDAQRRGEVTATALVERSIAAARATQTLNAWTHLAVDKALARAADIDRRRSRGEKLGPLAGVPVGVKDQIVTRGIPTTAGSRILEGWVPPYDATVIRRLEAADAIVLGKLNQDELAMGSSSESSAVGPVRNPWDPARVPGGSSGGSAAAVAAGVCPVSLGTDTGGSIRQPASFCGLVGLKPTYGRVSRYGAVAFASSLDQIGPLGRTVADVAAVFGVIAGHDPQDATSLTAPVPAMDDLGEAVAGLRVGVPGEYFASGLDPFVRAAVDGAIALLQANGAEVVPVELPHTRYAVATYYLVATAEASSNLSRLDGVRYGHRTVSSVKDIGELYARSRAEGFGPEVKRRILLGTFALSHGYYDAYYKKAQQVRTLIRRDFEQAFERCDVIVGPTSPVTAFGLGERLGDPLQMYLMDIYTIPSSLAGNTSVSVPCGFDPEGMPIGLQIIGPPLGEGRILRVASQLERLLPADERKPRVYAEGADMARADWEAVIGLEIHVQLATATKLFSAAPVSFGDEPNENIDPVTLGLPGALPVVNGRAVELAVRLGLAMGCEIDRASRFARKHYFYPDLPKGYQISQFEEPICRGGVVVCDVDGVEKRFRLTRIHLEEDAGKNVHEGGRSLVDLNRAGTALCEVVGEPELRSPADAVAYMKELHQIVVALGVCDGNMEQGNFRCDANVSVRRRGETRLGTRTEIKNVNSFRFVGRALEYEIDRQIALVESGGAVVQETRGWDDEKGVTRSQRGKEDAQDYRYFPDPDLMELTLDEAFVERVRSELPELPRARRDRFVRDFGLTPYDADVLTQSAARAAYFEAVATATGDGKTAANWVINEVLGALNKAGLDVESSPVSAAALADLLGLLGKGTLSSKMAKDCFLAMYQDGVAPAAWVAKNGGQITDTGAIEAVVREVLDKNPEQVQELLSGKDKVLGFFVGQIMKATRGKANPQQVNEILAREVESRR